MTATETPPGVFVPTVQADAPLVRYSVTDAMIQRYREDFGKLIISDSKSEAAVRTALTMMVRTRTGIEAEYKVLTAEANERIKLIRTEKNRIIAELAPTEEHLQAEWDRVQAEKARKKAEEEAAKQRAIQEKIDAANAARQAELDRQAAELAAEKAKQEEENRVAREALAAHQKRLEEQQAAIRAKEEAERREREAAEAARQAEERKRFEAEQKAERERLAKIEAEQRAERERLAEEKRKIEAEAARLKAEQDAKELAERIAREAEERRVAELERQAALKAREAALKPDREKLSAWAFELRAIKSPGVKSAEAKKAVATAMMLLNDAADGLSAFAGVEGKVAA